MLRRKRLFNRLVGSFLLPPLECTDERDHVVAGFAQVVTSRTRSSAVLDGRWRAGESKRMIEAILFDVGDTLVHYETSRPREFLSAGARAAHDCLRELGVNPPPFASYARAIRRTYLSAFLWSWIRRREARLIEALQARHRAMGIHMDRDQVEAILARSTAAVRGYFKPDEEAVGVAGRLYDTGFKMGIVSNTMLPASAVDYLLEQGGLLRWFPVRVYSSDVGYMKPHPRIFRAALDRLGVGAEQTIFVGDRVDKDIKGAARLGMTTVLLARNGIARRRRGGPDHVIRRLSELPPLVGS